MENKEIRDNEVEEHYRDMDQMWRETAMTDSEIQQAEELIQAERDIRGAIPN